MTDQTRDLQHVLTVVDGSHDDGDLITEWVCSCRGFSHAFSALSTEFDVNALLRAHAEHAEPRIRENERAILLAFAGQEPPAPVTAEEDTVRLCACGHTTEYHDRATYCIECNCMQWIPTTDATPSIEIDVYS